MLHRPIDTTALIRQVEMKLNLVHSEEPWAYKRPHLGVQNGNLRLFVREGSMSEDSALQGATLLTEEKSPASRGRRRGCVVLLGVGVFFLWASTFNTGVGFAMK